MVASSSTRWQEGHPRGCPFLMEEWKDIYVI
nr:MAG TPA: hypothetical protein [Caudoviricetes sp.]